MTNRSDARAASESARAPSDTDTLAAMDLRMSRGDRDLVGDPTSLALLGLAGTVLICLASATVSKWTHANAASKIRTKRESAAAAATESTTVNTASIARKQRTTKTYPEYHIEEVRIHASSKDAWVAIGDGVYDVTKWAPHHPGGERNIVDICGRWVNASALSTLRELAFDMIAMILTYLAKDLIRLC